MEWVEVPVRKDLRKKKPKQALRKPERTKRACPEAVLMEPSEGVSYAATLQNLKSYVNPEELGVIIGGIRESRTKDLLVEVKCAVRDRGWLDSAEAEARDDHVEGTMRCAAFRERDSKRKPSEVANKGWAGK